MAKKRGAGSGVLVKTTKLIREAEKDLQINRMWRVTFLATLGETSNVTKSAKAAEVSAARAYKVRREDSRFRREWQAALCEGYDHLELEVLRRLREGDFNHEGGGKFDFTSALRILAVHREAVGAQRARDSDAQEEAVYASITAKIAALRREKEAKAARLALPVPRDGDLGGSAGGDA